MMSRLQTAGRKGRRKRRVRGAWDDDARYLIGGRAGSQKGFCRNFPVAPFPLAAGYQEVINREK